MQLGAGGAAWELKGPRLHFGSDLFFLPQQNFELFWGCSVFFVKPPGNPIPPWRFCSCSTSSCPASPPPPRPPLAPPLPAVAPPSLHLFPPLLPPQGSVLTPPLPAPSAPSLKPYSPLPLTHPLASTGLFSPPWDSPGFALAAQAYAGAPNSETHYSAPSPTSAQTRLVPRDVLLLQDPCPSPASWLSPPSRGWITELLLPASSKPSDSGSPGPQKCCSSLSLPGSPHLHTQDSRSTSPFLEQGLACVWGVGLQLGVQALE